MHAMAGCEWRYLSTLSMFCVVLWLALVYTDQQTITDDNELVNCPDGHACCVLSAWNRGARRRRVCLPLKSCQFWLLTIMLLSGDIEMNPGPAHADHSYARKTEKLNTTNFGTICAAIGCNKYTMKNKEVAFHSFPKESDRCAKWVQNIRRADLRGCTPEELKHRKLCSDHFAASQFVNPLDRRSGLLPSAVPWIIDCPNPPKSEDTVRPGPSRRSNSVHEELPDVDEPMDQACPSDTVAESLTIGNLKRKISCYKQRLSRERKRKRTGISTVTLKREIARILPRQAAKFVNEQIDNAGKKKTAVRWSSYMKSLSLQFKGASPKAYNILRKIFKLPSPRTLTNILQKVDIGPGWHNAVFFALKHKAGELSDVEKNIVFCFDEISLKENLAYNISKDEIEGYDSNGKCANHAGVFMIRSLTSKWKQPIGYFLSNGTMPCKVLKEKATEGLERVIETGFVPIAFVMDQGSNNMSACRQLGITKTKPYFYINDTKVYYLFDPPHLMKNIRNNMRKHGFTISETLAVWGDIVELFKEDCKRQHRMVPKLTQKHLSLTPFSTMSVSLATQVLSHSVAAAMLTLVDMGKLRDGAKVTAEFVEKFNSLFDCFNSNTVTSNVPWKGAFIDKHVTFLNETEKWLDTVHCASGNKGLHCLEGWRHNINAMKLMWNELKGRGFEFLFTRHLNQDCLEHFFGVIRGKGGHRDNPDPCKFRQDYRQAVLDYLFTFGRNTNCEPEDIHLLLQLSHLFEKPSPSCDSQSCEQTDEQTDERSPTVTDSAEEPQPSTSLTLDHTDQTMNSSIADENIPGFPETLSCPFSDLDHLDYIKGLDDVEGNVSMYLAGYLCFRASSRYSCQKCEQLRRASDEEMRQLCEKYVFFNHKQYKGICRRQIVNKQIKLVKQMELEEMELAWEIWQKAAGQLKEIIEGKGKSPSELKDCPQKSRNSADSIPSKNLGHCLDGPLRTSSRIRKTPKKYIHELPTSGKNQKINDTKVIPSETAVITAAPSDQTVPHLTIQNTIESQQEIQHVLESAVRNAEPHLDNTHEPDQIIKTMVQNFIAKICKEHSTGDNNEDLTSQDSDLGGDESSKTDHKISQRKNPVKKRKRKQTAKGNLTNRKVGRKSPLSDDEMLQHGFKRLTTGGFICLTCEKTFPTPNKALLHTRIHKGSRPHQCGECGKAFRNVHSLQRHGLLHADQLPFPCSYPDCNKSYTEKRALDRHVVHKHPSASDESSELNQEPPEIYQCEECGKEIRYKANVAVHMKLCHEGQRDYQCSICGRLFQTKSNLLRHLMSHSSERPHPCVTCSRTFKTRDGLSKHLLLHQEKQHKCSICDKAFTTSYKLKEHMNSHEKTTVFICEQCGLGFNHRNTLRSHYRLHFQDRKFKCSICDWAFYTTSDLRRHKLTHSNDRPYECETCGKCFARKDAFCKHLRSHGGAAIYRCFYCGQSFWNRLRGKRHVMWCTGGDNKQEDYATPATEADDPHPEAPDQQQQQLDIIQIASTESNIEGEEEPSPETSVSSTVLNLTGMNLDIMSINSGYIIVRRPWSAEDTEDEGGQIVIAADSQAIQAINDAYEANGDEILQIEGELSIENDAEDGQNETDRTDDQEIFEENDEADAVDDSVEESPLERAMRQAGLHAREILQLQTSETQSVREQSHHEAEPSPSINSHNTTGFTVTSSNICADVVTLNTAEARQDDSANETLQFSDNATGVSNFSLQSIDCFPTEETHCPENQADSRLNEKGLEPDDQWFQW